MRRALAVTTVVGAMGVSPALGGSATIPSAASTASEVLARVNAHDARVESYAVPIHIDVRVKKLLTFHFGLDGTQYFKRPSKLALDVPRVPAQGKKLFAELGTPLTWPQQYDLRLVGTNGDRGPYRLEGVPKHGGDIARMVVDVDGDPAAPLHAQWWTTDGSTVDMRITEQAAGGYELPKHAEADLNVSGTKIHASIDYGAYVVNETIADAKFGGI
ncbi:MAG TPA: hypothetical protein VE826_04715 [Dongiaceae bacterium]|nr:hypothetical protein [Dongiaceae bacterium]